MEPIAVLTTPDRSLPASARAPKVLCPQWLRESRGLGLRHLSVAAIATSLHLGSQRRRKVRGTQASVALAAGEGEIDVAVNISRVVENRRRKKLSAQELKKLRATEIRSKINVLKGRLSVAGRYRRQRDAERAQAERGEEGEAKGSARQEGDAGKGRSSQTEEEGEAIPEWAFDKDAKSFSRKPKPLVSDDARAVAETELNGEGGVATSRQLIDAGSEYKSASQFCEAAELFSLARERIDKEQLNRTLDYKTAIELEDEALEKLGEVYMSSGRLTLALNTFDILRLRQTDSQVQKRAQIGWVKAAFKLSGQLQEEFRWQEALDVLMLVRDVAQTGVAGFEMRDEVEIFIGIVLDKLGRTKEAKNVLAEARRNCGSRKRKAQIMFVLDVMSVDTSGERNEEFHKLWEENFVLPTDSVTSMGVARAKPVYTNLSQQEKEFRTWASKYWEERLKSPAYYIFLTLWVTWPFAIPVVSIMRRSGMLE